MILWENFDKNEIYLLVMLVVAYSAFFLFPKRLSTDITLLFLVWGFATSTLFDFTIGGGLLDFYKVNDSNQYELFDFLGYFLFAPFSYFYIYFYQKFNITRKRFIFYVLVWCVIALGMEWLSTWMDVIHYQNGYKLHYSLVVFLTTQTVTTLYYELVKKSQPSLTR
ncbi:hypothetical protein [Sutcliffiella halmapala]|uniref:hypothetical protein n=1 Tax=Sutcliffiella halmapala TaxID=79882 RepID=UPI0009955F1C|nr:hypothetical protein [Sutcliffiella halmapala]